MLNATDKEKIERLKEFTKTSNFSDEDRQVVGKYMEILTRKSIVSSNLNGFNDLFEEHMDVFDEDTFIGFSVMTQVLKKWDDELNEQLRAMDNQITEIVYRDAIGGLVGGLKGALFPVIMSNKGLPKAFATKFLNEKFGTEPSSSKDAMIGMCVECMEFFMNLVNTVDDNTISELANM